MSKTPQFDEEQPPPYTESSSTGAGAGAGAGAAINAALPTSLTASLTSSLTAHIRALPERMCATEQARSTQQATFDLNLITLLIPHVEAFLSDLGTMPSSAAMAELTLVPAAAVPKGCSLSGAVERRSEGETLRVERVERASGMSSKEKASWTSSNPASGSVSKSTWITSVEDTPSSSTKCFDSSRWDDDEGTSMTEGDNNSWWWRDERMARRLAAYLQPKMQPRVERKHIQAVVEKAKEDKKFKWGRGRKKTAESSSGLPVTAYPPTPSSNTLGSGDAVLGDLDDRVTMTVRAEEVTFRRENDFGVWESLTGFGIVVVVRVKR